LVWPSNLSYFHVFEPSRGITPLVIASIAGILGVAAAIVFLRRRAPEAAYGLLFIFIPLAPALNIAGVGANVFAERYLYLPSVGLALAAAVAWNWLAERNRQAAWGLTAVAVLVSSVVVIDRNPDWHDDLRIYEVSVRQYPQAAMLWCNLGGLYFQRDDFDHAMADYQKAIDLDPSAPLYHLDLGNTLKLKGQLAAAETELRKAIALDPEYFQAYNDLGLVLELAGRNDEALTDFQKSLAIQPNYAEAMHSLALVRIRAKDYAGAIPLLEKAIEARTNFNEAYMNLGVAYNGVGRYQDAARVLRRITDNPAPGNPNLYAAHFTLGITYYKMNSIDAASYEFNKTLQLKPDYTPAREFLDRMKTQGK